MCSSQYSHLCLMLLGWLFHIQLLLLSDWMNVQATVEFCGSVLVVKFFIFQLVRISRTPSQELCHYTVSKKHMSKAIWGNSIYVYVELRLLVVLLCFHLVLYSCEMSGSSWLTKHCHIAVWELKPSRLKLRSYSKQNSAFVKKTKKQRSSHFVWGPG